MSLFLYAPHMDTTMPLFFYTPCMGTTVPLFLYTSHMAPPCPCSSMHHTWHLCVPDSLYTTHGISVSLFLYTPHIAPPCPSSSIHHAWAHPCPCSSIHHTWHLCVPLPLYTTHGISMSLFLYTSHMGTSMSLFLYSPLIDTTCPVPQRPRLCTHHTYPISHHIFSPQTPYSSTNPTLNSTTHRPTTTQFTPPPTKTNSKISILEGYVKTFKKARCSSACL